MDEGDKELIEELKLQGDEDQTSFIGDSPLNDSYTATILVNAYRGCQIWVWVDQKLMIDRFVESGKQPPITVTGNYVQLKFFNSKHLHCQYILMVDGIRMHQGDVEAFDGPKNYCTSYYELKRHQP